MGWSYTAGEYGNSVRVYERTPGGIIYGATRDPTAAGGERRVSLRHRDREKAKSWADREAAKLREGAEEARSGTPTVRRILRAYTSHQSPEKSPEARNKDHRRAELWRRFLGNDFDLSKLSRGEWDRFTRLRSSGAIDARGRPVPEGERTPVGPRTVAIDLGWLRTVCKWATDFRDRQGALLLERDPTRGREIPKEKNPTRPVATTDRVEAVREVYRDVEMRLERGGKRERVESYLPEIFEIVVGTGRRISAVCSLRFEDLDLDRTPKAPHGAIVWPADTDKMEKEWRCPVSARVREALDAALRKRRRVGPGPLFPRPSNPDEPLRYDEARAWLQEAEDMAEGVEALEGGCWHPYRRLWATSRKDLPDVDVAKAGGWASLQALQDAYQHPDDETMLKVVEHEAEVREVR